MLCDEAGMHGAGAMMYYQECTGSNWLLDFSILACVPLKHFNALLFDYCSRSHDKAIVAVGRIIRSIAYA